MIGDARTSGRVMHLRPGAWITPFSLFVALLSFRSISAIYLVRRARVSVSMVHRNPLPDRTLARVTLRALGKVRRNDLECVL